MSITVDDWSVKKRLPVHTEERTMVWMKRKTPHPEATRDVDFLLYVNQETEAILALIEERLIRETDRLLFWEARDFYGNIIGLYLTPGAAKKAVEEYV